MPHPEAITTCAGAQNISALDATRRCAPIYRILALRHQIWQVKLHKAADAAAWQLREGGMVNM